MHIHIHLVLPLTIYNNKVLMIIMTIIKMIINDIHIMIKHINVDRIIKHEH